MTPGSEGVAASTQKPRNHDSTHGVSPSKDPRDDDDLVILGATQPRDIAVCDLLAGDSNRLREEQERDPNISLVMKHLVDPDLKNAFGHKSGTPKWFKRKRN